MSVKQKGILQGHKKAVICLRPWGVVAMEQRGILFLPVPGWWTLEEKRREKRNADLTVCKELAEKKKVPYWSDCRYA